MSATTIIDQAPLGELIRFSDGSPKPPARFTKKLAAWERSNGVGRLVKKEPPRPYPTWMAPTSFTPQGGPVVEGAGDVAALLGVAPRTGRATMKSLLDDGVVGSETPRGALMLRFPSKTHDALFPRLFDLT